MHSLQFALYFGLALSLAYASSPTSAVAKNDTTKLRAQSRVENAKMAKENKVKSDMQAVLQQHLVGPNVASAVVQDHKSEKLDLWSKWKEDKQKGKLQTVGSVIGDIIGVLVSEIARFFGSVVSDVAREVTAHGFVLLIKQIADLTGLSPSHSAPAPVHFS